MSQTRRVVSLEPEMAVLASDILRQRTVEVWPLRVWTQFLERFSKRSHGRQDIDKAYPVDRSQTRTSRSQPPLTSMSSQGTIAHTPMT